jgi:CRP-like cAMP-binding protein
MRLIKEEFENNVGKERALTVLNCILKDMKFFIRFSDNERKMILQRAEFLHVPAQTVIFNQGDEPDKMYIILKGRVAVEKAMAEVSNMPVVVALLKDGDHFGELGTVSTQNIDENIKDTGLLHNDYRNWIKQTYQKRKATCITAEDTDMLVLDKEVCYLLY